MSPAPVNRGQARGEPPKGRVGLWLKRVAILLFFAITLSAAAWLAYPYRDKAVAWVSSLASASPASAPVIPPLSGYQAQKDATDAAFQRAVLWQTLKRDFPDWYDARVGEVAAAVGDQRSPVEIHPRVMQALVELRRKHAGDALSATPAKLLTLASAFADTLVRLRTLGVDACYGFIVNGETTPAFYESLADPARAGPFQAQLVAVFEAVSDGRRLPRVYPVPKQSDYNLLVTRLEARGWTDRDMALFSDSQAFAKAAPEKVCQMVTDWFQSQLELKDSDAQLRLLADSLRPVVAG